MSEQDDGRHAVAMDLLEDWRVKENLARSFKDLHARAVLKGMPNFSTAFEVQYRQARIDADHARLQILELMGVDS